MRIRPSLLMVVVLAATSLHASAKVHYVDRNCKNPAAPYTDWSTAAATIQDAVDVALTGDQVLVTNGVYSFGGRPIDATTNRVTIDQAILISSANGPLATTILGAAPDTNGQGAVRCVYVGNNAVLSGFTLSNGWAQGGGAYCETWGVVSNCVIVGNYGSGAGGGGVYGGTLYNCVLAGNRTGAQGGGAYYSALHSCALTGNSAGYEGGGASFCDLYNCTLTGNSAVTSSGGAGAGRLYNCIAWYNSARSNPNVGTAYDRYWDEEILPTVNYCCTTPLPTDGLGNISAEPQLASATHLSSSSPCIGAGFWTIATGTDIDGEPWSNPPCIGADQYVPMNASGGLTVDFAASYTNVAISFPVSFNARVEGRTTASVWNFGDGTIVSNQPYATHAWAHAGSYRVTLTAYNDSQPAGVAVSGGAEVSDITYYVDRSSLNPTFPYTNWGSAAQTIQEAVSASTLPGRLVLVTNGVYDRGGMAVVAGMSNRVSLLNPVWVASVNGPEVTVILGAPGPGGTNGDGAIRCAYVGPGALLSGFTLTNGHTRNFLTARGNEQLSGGGVWCEYGGAVSNCVITGNAADATSGSGGGSQGGNLYHCTLSGNSAYTGGGACGSVLVDCTVSGNYANDLGGGANGGTLSNCVLSGNQADHRGGGVYGCTLINCTLTRNRASGWGGILQIEGGGAFGGILENCALNENSASDNGGGACGSTLCNSTLTGNSAYQGGGAYLSTLRNCTVAANSAISGGGVWFGYVYNSIVYYNEAPIGANSASDAWTFNYSCTTPLPAGGIGNISSEPRLASWTHLSAASPCLAAGSSAYASGVDIDGGLWLSPPSIGADQYVAGGAAGALTVAIGGGVPAVAKNWPLSLAARIDGAVTASVWDFGDGTIVSNSPGAIHMWTSPGTYAVRLTAYNDSFPMGESATQQVEVLEPLVHYVNCASSAPAYPFGSWETAATTIQDAVDAARPGEGVLVTNGVYRTGGRAIYGSMTNRIAITQPIRLTSANGPSVTAIEGSADSWDGNGENATRCVYLGPGAVLSGFTLTNGHTRAWSFGQGFTNELLGGGGVWCENTAVVTNCIIAGNSAGGFGGGAYLGSLYKCVISNNSLRSVPAQGGGAYRASLEGCSLSGNWAEDGGGGYQSKLSNCYLTANYGYYGGGASGSSLYNCVLDQNLAGYGGGAISSSLYNCTLCRNSAQNQSGGAAYCSLYNSIGYYNLAPMFTNCDGCLMEYCCTTPLPAGGNGNISEEPAFVSLSSGDLRLTTSSPCINSGCNESVDAAFDLDGNPRIAAATVDMGAYEFLRPASLISFAWLEHYGLPIDGSADLADSDGDGMNNWQEWRAGTDPRDPGSTLRLSSAASDSSGVMVTWQSVSNRTYFIERSVDLSARPAFQTLATNIAGQAGTTSFYDASATGFGPFFYRVGVK